MKWKEVEVFYPALSPYSAVYKGVHEGAARRKK
jgi:hypothetical protein